MKLMYVFQVLVLVAMQFVVVSAQAAAPTIAPIPDQTVYVDHPALVELMVSDAETPTNLLTFRLSGYNTSLIDTNKDVLFRWFTDGGPSFMPRWYITIAPTFGQTGISTNTVTVSDGTNTTSTSFVLNVVPPPALATRFVNTNQILLPASGVASQYPTTNVVTGMVGTVTNVVVTFSRLTHQNPNDLHMLLVSPSGQGIVMWSKVGGGGPLGGTPPDHAVTNVTATVTDAAPDWSPLPDFYWIWTERFRPANYAAVEPPANNFPAPAPAGPYAPTPVSNAFHNAFNGQAPNGTWSLYIYDDQAPYTGSIAGGWSLTVMTSGPQPPTISDIANQTILTNTSTAALPFTIGDTDTPIGSLTLGKASSNAGLVPTNNIVFGGSGANRTVTITPIAGQSGTSTITLSVSDGTNITSDSFLLTVLTTLPQVTSFTNAAGIGIRDTNAALPYPATINVTGLSGVVGNVTATLRGFNQAWGSDVDVLLVGPSGQKMILMSDAGSGPVTNANVTFSDAATLALPVSGLVTGTYRPTNYSDASPLGDNFPSPAPAGPYGTNFSVFDGTAPNGTWSLYVLDDGPGDTGAITNGWSLTLTTQAGVPSNTAPTLSVISNQVTVVNTPTTALPFTIGDTETAASNLVVSVFTSNSALAPTNSLVLGGSGTNRTLTVTPTSNQLGSATISLTVSDGSLVTSNSFLLTVNPAVLTVTENSASRRYGATNPVLTGSLGGLQAGDVITASFSSSANTNAPVGGYPITFTLADPGSKLGNYVIITNHGTLTVTNAALTVSAGSTNKIYGASLNPAGYLVTGLLNSDSVTNLTLSSAGSASNAPVASYAITATNALGVGLTNYLISYSNGTLTVAPAGLTVTANSTNKTYGGIRTFAGSEFTITSGTLFSGATLSGVTLASTGAGANAPAGAYAITATNAVGAGLSNYVISYSNGTLTVDPASLLVVASSTNKLYGTTLDPVNYTVTGLLNSDTVTNVTLTSVGSVSNAPVGSYTVNASGAQGAGLTNYAIGYSNGTLTVNAAGLLITALATNKIYGTTLSPAAYTVSGLANGDSVTNVTLTSAGSGSLAPVGSYAITAGAAQGTGLTNYNVGYSDGLFTVNAASLLVTADSTNKVYGATLEPINYTVTGLLNGDSVTNVSLASAGSVSNAAVGSYAINASAAGGLGLTNYVVGYADGTLSVGVASLVVTADSTNKVYGVVLNPTGYGVSGLLNGDSVTNVTLASAGGASTAAAGSYLIHASGAQGVGLTNYVVGYSDGTLTVNPASLLVVAIDTNKVYGATLSPAGYNVSGLLNTDTVTNVTLTSAGSASTAPVGTYVIGAAEAAGVGLTNYVVGYSNGMLTVSVADLLITATDTNKIYGATLNLTDYTVAGLMNSDVVTNVVLLSAGGVDTAPVGGYPITASDATGVGLTNYAIGYSNGTLTVAPASLLITAVGTNKSYGGTLAPAGYTTGPLAFWDAVTNVTLVSAGSVSNAPAGSYPIIASAAAGPGLTNYTIGYSNASLVVTQAVLVATADDFSRAYGQPNPVFTISYSGFVNGEGTNVLDLLPTAGSTATITSAPGNYAIAVAGGADDNYLVSLVAGSLTVSPPGPVTIITAEYIEAVGFRIAGTGDANVPYKVHASADFVSWEEVGTATSNGGGGFEFVDTAASGFTARYYRIATP